MNLERAVQGEGRGNAILALLSFKSETKLSLRHTQIRNLSLPQKTGSFKNVHFHSRHFLLHLVFSLPSSKKVLTDWQSLVYECSLSYSDLKYDYLGKL